MSCPVLSLHVGSNASRSDVAEYLCVEVPATESSVRSRIPLAQFGAIEVAFRDPWVQEECYGSDWKFCVEFDSPYGWSTLRQLLALELCKHLHSKSGGAFLAAHDTGSVAFYLRDNELVLPKEDTQHFSLYPSPFETWRFAVLPAV